MNDYEKQVRDFHSAYEHAIAEPFSPELLRFRKKMLEEELGELVVEIDDAVRILESGGEIDRDLYLRMVKELADLQYVVSGFAVSFGINLKDIFALVHESNMSKLDENGRPIKRADGKILKGPNYHPPKFDSVKGVSDEV